MVELTHLSLFTGIGGLDLAAEWGGFRTVGQCEWADYPRAVLEKHWPGMPRWRDIRTLTGGDFYEQTGLRTVTVLSGGFPCQPFSTAGKRRGEEDDRYLWPEMLRVISEIRPSWVVGENVAGIVSIALDTVLSDLESIGYTCQAFVIPACAVDAPHRRDRVAIIAHSDCDIGGSRWTESTGQQRQARVADGSDDVPDSNQVRRGMRGFEREGIQWQEPSRNETDSGGKTVADTNGKGQQGRKQLSAHFCGQPCGSACECGETVSNADSTVRPVSMQTRRRWPGPVYICKADTDCDDRRWDVRRECELPAIERNGRCRGNNCGGTPEHGGWEWWPVEPDVGRVAHGVPSRVDRLKCLGNAVVPQQFYPIFRAIADIEALYE